MINGFYDYFVIVCANRLGEVETTAYCDSPELGPGESGFFMTELKAPNTIGLVALNYQLRRGEGEEGNFDRLGNVPFTVRVQVDPK